MGIELVNASDLSAELWQAFASLRDANDLYDDPFFDPDFASVVAEVRDDVHVIIASEGNVPVAFWPLHCRAGSWARPIGGPFSDWHGPVLAKDSELTPSDLLDGAGLPGFTAFALPAVLSGMRNTQRCGAHMTDLSEGWDVFLESQKARFPKHFKKMRRVTRNIEKDFSDVEYILDDRTDDAFSWLLARKRDQYLRTGKHDVLSPAWAQELMSGLRAHHGPRLRARLSTLRFDGRLAAAEFNLISDKVIHGWLTAYEGDFARYSPGFLLQHNILRQMPLCGLTRYDSGPGLDHYKKVYSNFYLPVDAGIVLPTHTATTPARLFGHGWKVTEDVMPGPIARLMGKARQRSDQILLSETDLAGRARGFAHALFPSHI